MAKVLISLVSDQTIPNLLLIKELAFIDRFIFISTDKMEKQGRSDWIIDASGITSDKYIKVKVIEDSLKDIEDTLNTIDFDDDDEIYVNLTGGTKIMSIGVYNFFRNKRSEIYYIPIGKNIYRKIFPEVKQREMQIDYRTDVIQYLKAYGIEIINPKKLNTLTIDAKYTRRFYQMFLESGDSAFDLLNNLRPFRGKSISINAIEGLGEYLDNIQFPRCNQDTLTKKEVKYLTGEWFEEYVYHFVKAQIGSDEKSIALNINIKRQNVQNEFDVMFTSDNTLHVIECKSSIYDPDSEKNILDESLYKLAALRRDFGLFAKAYLFTLSERGDTKENVRPFNYERSKLLHIKIMDGTDFTNGFDLG